MTRRPKTWPPTMRPPTAGDPTVWVGGHRLVRIDGQWCGQTQAGTWRSASWLGLVTHHALLDHIHATQQPPRSHATHTPLAGQLDLLAT